MNIAAAHSYSALPAWLIEVPSGITNEATRFDTPTRFSRQSSETGSVEADDAVENAVSNAGDMPRNRPQGRTRPAAQTSSGSTTKACSASPATTTTPKRPIGPATLSRPALATVWQTRAKTP